MLVRAHLALGLGEFLVPGLQAYLVRVGEFLRSKVRAYLIVELRECLV
jgi:hypothetical protein